MKQLFLTLSFAFGLLSAEAQTGDLPRVAPEQTGVKSEQVVAFFDSLMAFPKTDIHSAIVMRHGKVIGEIHPAPFKAEYSHTLFSCSKTFASAAIGIAIGEHRLKLTDRLATFFPEYLPKEVSEWLSDITIEDLLTMRSGFVFFDEVRSEHSDWVKAMMSPHVKDFYGYQMWMCEWPDAARADGAYGQYIIVNPQQDMVVIITQCLTGDGNKEQRLIKNVLFPGIVADGKNIKAGKAYRILQKKQAAYTLPLLEGKKSNKLITSHLNKPYQLDKNPLGWKQITFLTPQKMEVEDSVGRKGIIEMGFKQWKTSDIGIYPQNPRGTTSKVTNWSSRPTSSIG